MKKSPRRLRNSPRPASSARRGAADTLSAQARAFQESRVLLTAIELDVFTAVGKGATAAAVARRCGTHPRSTEMLLNALTAIGGLRKRGGRFYNTPRTAKLFVAGSPSCERDAWMHTVHLWDRWSNLTECVRQGAPRGRREAADRGAAWLESFIAAMHRNAQTMAPMVAKAVGLSGVRRMLDVGGGSGAYAIAFAKASRTLQADVLDLPPVLPIAERHIREAGLPGRVRTRPGDLRSGALGENYDLILLSAICHMLTPEENQDLLRRCFAALAPGGRVVIRDFVLNPDKTSPRAAALFSLNMLVGTAGGASYSAPEYRAWLARAGFARIRCIAMPDPSSGLVLGTRARSRSRRRTGGGSDGRSAPRADSAGNET